LTEARSRSGTGTPRRAETRRKLVEAAYDVFMEHGIRDASIELICEAAGFSRGAFYSNFETKEDLFLAVYEREMATRMAEVRKTLDTAIEPSMSVDDDALRAGIAKIARMCTEPLVADRYWYLLITEFRAHALRNPDLQALARAALEHVTEYVGEMMREALDRLGLELVVSARDAVAAFVAVYEAEVERVSFAGTDSAEATSLLTEVVPRLVSALVVRREPGR
jgi:AcrR family transcriptional regulator